MPLPDYLPGRFALARGRPCDYFALEQFHYLPQRPATYADVWVVRYDEPRDPRSLASWLWFDVRCSKFDVRRSRTAEGRRTPNTEHRTPNIEVERGNPFAAHDALEARWRCDARRDEQDAARLAAVGVLSFPSFRSLPRERTLNLRYLSHRQRLAFTNAHVRTISRVIVHPQFRALGLASELVRQLIKSCPTRYVEASAVMARVHPFFETAGMRRVLFDGAGGREGDASERDDDDDDDERKPAYFIFDKGEGSSCDH
jgi:GNAT superfamily N-acetyltransferase